MLSTWKSGSGFLNSQNETGPAEAFGAPWQVEAYALGQALVASGLVPIKDWTNALSAALRHRLDDCDAPDNSDTYYAAVAEALSNLVVREGLITEEDIQTRTDAWRNAYKSTPHGKPVSLD
jgi:nitrile hydratase accessory protein